MTGSKIKGINGPVVTATGLSGFKVREMVLVGTKKLIGEIIALEGVEGTIQVYEETEWLQVGEGVEPTGRPLSVALAPGMLGNMFDGIQRPLNRIRDAHGDFIPEGIGLMNLDRTVTWPTQLHLAVGDKVCGGMIYGEVQETEVIIHRLLLPPEISGTVEWVASDGDYTIEAPLLRVLSEDGVSHEVPMVQYWPVRVPRPIASRHPITQLLKTGQRILDVFFPIAKGGTCAIPGSFGTGKTMTQHQLAKYADADIIIYIGCGERGNEMTEVLEDFPKLIDPYSEKPLMDRTVLIANTSNMPVAAREASIYTGITMAEYYRDMGYHVAIMADSTSRWAEALREISGRLEEMPAEEGYPAYLSSRIAQFYERAGYVSTLSQKEGSVTIIGAVSPAGGDFSEPVTENTKRYVNVFLALDKNLAYARHYPAINWMESYSRDVEPLRPYYEEAVDADVSLLRTRALNLLHEEAKLNDIVMLVGEDVLPDDQRFLMAVARVIKNGYLQQNAFHKEDTYVPLEKQVRMLEVIDTLYTEGKAAIDSGLPYQIADDRDLFGAVVAMKYTIPNDDLSGIDKLILRIRAFYRSEMEGDKG